MFFIDKYDSSIDWILLFYISNFSNLLFREINTLILTNIYDYIRKILIFFNIFT